MVNCETCGVAHDGPVSLVLHLIGAHGEARNNAIVQARDTCARSHDKDERIRQAAPELLDALERLVHMAECNTMPGPNTLAQARAAIAKARGEA